MINLNNVSKKYGKKKNDCALKNFNYVFEDGKMYAIMGPSGSGKSTLLHLIGQLDNPSNGKIKYDIENCNKKHFKTNIGFIFQSFYLNKDLNVYENLLVPSLITKGKSTKEIDEKIYQLLNKLDISDKIKYFPSELSGGEQQRVAIARALINNPKIILADEPTGNLDIENEKMIFSILKELSMHGCCVIVATHSENIMNYTNNIIRLDKGKIVHDK